MSQLGLYGTFTRGLLLSEGELARAYAALPDREVLALASNRDWADDRYLTSELAYRKLAVDYDNCSKLADSRDSMEDQVLEALTEVSKEDMSWGCYEDRIQKNVEPANMIISKGSVIGNAKVIVPKGDGVVWANAEKQIGIYLGRYRTPEGIECDNGMIVLANYVHIMNVPTAKAMQGVLAGAIKSSICVRPDCAVEKARQMLVRASYGAELRAEPLDDLWAKITLCDRGKGYSKSNHAEVLRLPIKEWLLAKSLGLSRAKVPIDF